MAPIDISRLYYTRRDGVPDDTIIGFDLGDDRVTIPFEDAQRVSSVTGRAVTTEVGVPSVRVWITEFSEFRRKLAERGLQTRVEQF